MKSQRLPLVILTALTLAPGPDVLRAQVPTLLHYQGRAVVGTTNFNGLGQFEFALVNTDGTITYWSNDGTSVGGSQPAHSIAVPTVNGLYAVLLGDTTVANMTAVPASVFTNSDVRLRVWFNDGTFGFQQVAPDQRIASVGYAMIAATVPNGAITASQLAPNSVTVNNISDNTITAGKISAGQVVKTLNGLSDNVNVIAGPGLSVTPSGNNLQVAMGDISGLAWGFNGNPGAGRVLGTSDNTPLILEANGQQAMRYEFGGPSAQLGNGLNTGAPNVVGGSPVNFVASGVVGSAIGGGGAVSYGGTPYTNTVASDFGTIGGGNGNSIQDSTASSTIGGGSGNTIQTSGTGSAIAGGIQNSIQTNAFLSSIGGGFGNSIQTGSYESTVGGGVNNTIQAGSTTSTIGGGNGNSIQASSPNSTIAGGAQNTIQSNTFNATIGGGNNNTIQSTAIGSAIAGGVNNAILGFCFQAFIGGGYQNTIQFGSADCFIGGGYQNTIQTECDTATLAGGYQNNIQATSTTIGGGQYNNIQSGANGSVIAGGVSNTVHTNANIASIGGGQNNQVSASGATVPGGTGNLAAGVNSFAAGTSAHANHDGAFVLTDDQVNVFSSTTLNQFSARFGGGYILATSVDGGGNPIKAVTLAPSGNSWGSISDRNAKKNFAPVDGREVLEKLASVPVQKWNYNWEKDDDVANLGPMAQDFVGAFYPGRDDKVITTMEFDGVELAAIQGLNEIVREKDAQITALQKQVAALQEAAATHRQALDKVEARFDGLEKTLLRIQGESRGLDAKMMAGDNR